MQPIDINIFNLTGSGIGGSQLEILEKRTKKENYQDFL